MARPEQDVFEAGGGDYGCYAGVPEEMPGGGYETGGVVEGEPVEDVEEDFGGELVDWEGVEFLEVEAGLETFFNPCGA